MGYHLDFSDQTIADINFHLKSGNKAVLKKIYLLLDEILNTLSQPKLLKYNLSGNWSRRINKEHRLVYEVLNDTINVLSAKGHYK